MNGRILVSRIMIEIMKLVNSSIRTYDPSDFKRLVKLVQAFRAEMAQLDTTGTQIPLSDSGAITYTERLVTDATNMHGALFVSIVNNEIAGFVQGITDRHQTGDLQRLGNRPGLTGWIGTLFVDPTYRGSGQGRALLEHIAKAFETAGCDSLRLLVLATNPHAISLYQSFGFSAYEYDMAKSLEERL